MNKLLLFLCLIGIAKAEAQNASALAVADSLYQVGAYSQAIAAYGKLEVSPQVYQRIGQAYETLGKTPQALDNYKNALGLNPENLTVAYKYGTLLRVSGNFKAADSIFADLQNKHPNNASVLYQLGYVKEQLKDSTAVVRYMQAYQLDNNQQNALYRLSKLLLEKREFNSAKNFIDQGLNADPKSIRFLTLDALSYYINKSYHDAIDQYERLIELGRDNLINREKLAISYAQTFQYPEAIANFKILINTYDDQNPSWHYGIGKCFIGIEDLVNAKRHINIAIGLVDLPLDAYFVSLAIAYNREGDYAEVIRLLKLAISENPLNERAHYQLAVAADNYYQDRLQVISLYQNYINLFQDRGNYSESVALRLSDLRKEAHLNKD